MRYRILIVNGPNLNLLGVREKNHYGIETLEKIMADAERICNRHDIEFKHFQSNSESEIINFIQKEGINADYLIINPAAFTHTSIAIRDAILSVKIKTIEVHISNIFAREEFRHISYISDIADGVITGLGGYGYQAALYYIINNRKT